MRRLILIAGLTLIPVSSFAAEESATGATLSERMQALQTRMEKRVPESISVLIPDAAKKKSWDAERKRHAERMAELRRKCREEIRKANRDTIVEKSQQCFRSDLLEELALHRKEQAYVASLPGVDADFQSAFQAALTKLMDAEVAIVNGVDTGVYSTVELLQTAKRKLRDQYRIPYWTALARLNGDRQIPWLAWHVDRLQALLAEAPETDVSVAFGCLEEAANLAYASRAADFTTVHTVLRGAVAKSRECVTTLRNLIKTEG